MERYLVLSLNSVIGKSPCSALQDFSRIIVSRLTPILENFVGKWAILKEMSKNSQHFIILIYLNFFIYFEQAYEKFHYISVDGSRYFLNSLDNLSRLIYREKYYRQG